MCKKLCRPIFLTGGAYAPYAPCMPTPLEEWRDLKTRGKGRSMSLKMAPFDRSYDFQLVRHC